MSRRSEELSQKIKGFSDDVIAFVESLSDGDWRKVCESEEWPVGVTAYHLGAGHFAIFDLARMIVRGEDLPQLTMEQITAMSNKQARENMDCTKADALAALRKNSAEMVAFVVGLSDDELDRKGRMPAFGGEATTEQFLQFVIFESAAQHLDSMKAAVGR